MLTGLPRGLVALGRIWALPGVGVAHRRVAGDPARDAPPPLPDVVRRDQPAHAGHGPLLHRTFAVRVTDPRLGPRALVAVLAADMNRAMVPGVARFDPVTSTGRALAVDDELVVRMPGPWDGPVRVVDRTDEPGRSSFRLATLAGHLEAGQIEFAATTSPDGLIFTVTTWARAGDRCADLMYNRLGVAREIQFQLWVHCCVAAADVAGGSVPDGVEVTTRSLTWSDALAEQSAGKSAADV
ncbi:DUF1990 domain-containing protein [Actinomycetospora endophytica]|uniref:DUF1990 domain-containing protein n=1 Tax=Actinomycetospora endophytica TaxID=2291215 RepID=A0ABS8P274_9PSEU|nr:DUF1990 family protein [Actinomycetospora endophytica]MCD2192347.1 DUF1990 domain-containing protein [Actinomycetospora endophytica]